MTPLTNLLEKGDGIIQSVIIPYLIPSSMFSIAVYDTAYVNNINSILNLRAANKTLLRTIDDDRCVIPMKALISKSQKYLSMEEEQKIQNKSTTLQEVIHLYRRKLTVLDINSLIDVHSKFHTRTPVKSGWLHRVWSYDIPSWYEARVIGFTPTKIIVHYMTWGKRYEGSVNIGEFKTRVSEHGTKIYIPGNKLKLGDRVDCKTLPDGIWRESRIIAISDKFATVKCDIRRNIARAPLDRNITNDTYCFYDTIQVPLTSSPWNKFPHSDCIKQFGHRSRGLSYSASLRL
jgi:hypothetical protein